MAETIGTITNIKLITVGWDFPNPIDAGAITILDDSNASRFFYLWVSHADDPAVNRVLQSQRLALAREAAFRKLRVHVFNEPDSNLIFEINVDIP